MLERFSPETVHKQLTTRLRQQLADFITIAEEVSPRALRDQLGANALRILGSIQGANPHDIVTDPQVVSWLHIAATIVNAYEDNLTNCRLWLDHLSDLNLLAAGMALATGNDFDFRIHNPRGHTVRFPGVGVSMRGVPQGETLSVVVRGGQCVNVPAGIVAETIRIADYEFVFRGDPIVVPDVPGYMQIQRDQFDGRWASALRRAHDLLLIGSKSQEVVRYFARLVGPLESAAANIHLSVTSGTFQNAIFLSYNEDPLVLAEAIVHEGDHNLVYGLTRVVDLWGNSSALDSAVYWSPWRDDARPLDGILRGASAFTTVSEWLLDITSSPSVAPEVRRRSYLRAVRTARQVVRALEQIHQFGTDLLTAEGASFLAQLDARIQCVADIVKSFPGYSDYAVEVAHEIRQHQERHSRCGIDA